MEKKYTRKDIVSSEMSLSIALSDELFDPPPWNTNEFPEKTEGWIERQRWERKKKQED